MDREVIGVLYLLAALCLWPVFALVAVKVMAHEFSHGEPETEDFIAGAAIGTIAVTIWPLVLLMAVMYLFVRRVYAARERIRSEAEEARR